MFTQIFIVVLGLFLVVQGLQSSEYVSGGVGALIAIAAASTIYKLKTGK